MVSSVACQVPWLALPDASVIAVSANVDAPGLRQESVTPVAPATEVTVVLITTLLGSVGQYVPVSYEMVLADAVSAVTAGVGTGVPDGASVSGAGDGVAFTMAVSVGSGRAPSVARASSGAHSATGSADTSPVTVRGVLWTQASVLPGRGKWIRSQPLSSVRPVTSRRWPLASLISGSPLSGQA